MEKRGRKSLMTAELKEKIVTMLSSKMSVMEISATIRPDYFPTLTVEKVYFNVRRWVKSIEQELMTQEKKDIERQDL